MTGKKRTSKSLIGLLTILLVSSCSTTSYVDSGHDYPILNIQTTVVENLPEGLGATNSNRRIFYSKKFTVKQENNSKIPLIMRIIIEGERRPYTLEVEVRKVSPVTKNIEEAFEFGGDFKGQDSLAKRVVTSIKDQLAQRRKNKNLFDDFKPF